MLPSYLSGTTTQKSKSLCFVSSRPQIFLRDTSRGFDPIGVIQKEIEIQEISAYALNGTYQYRHHADSTPFRRSMKKLILGGECVDGM